MYTLKICQTKSMISGQYRVSHNGRDIYEVETGVDGTCFYYHVKNNGEVVVSAFHDTERAAKLGLKFGAKRITHIYSLFDKMRNRCGEICRKKTKSFGGYFYYEVELNKHIYTAYEIGLGKEGIKIPIYRGEKQIALIQKDCMVRNNLDEYEIIFGDLEMALVATVFVIYYDCLNHNNPFEAVVDKKETKYLYTMNKELNSKYDPNWRP